MKHGFTETKFYKTFTRLKSRCSNKNWSRYYLYGGRGIKCLWKSFEEFKDDMYDSYLKHVAEFGENNTSIDRIDPNGHYSKENCRWATTNVQMNNKRSHALLTYKGKTQNVSQWARETGLAAQTITYRKGQGWDVEKILTTKPKNTSAVKTIAYVTRQSTIKEIVEMVRGMQELHYRVSEYGKALSDLKAKLLTLLENNGTK